MEAAGDDEIRLLLVDDDADVLAVTRMHLERENDAFAITTATGAGAAVDALGDHVDCVVSDYEMPDRDGLDLLRSVRAAYPDLPFVLFTARGSEEIASEAISAGVTDYLQKGTGTDQYTVLANRVENAVARRRSAETAAETETRYRSLVESSPNGIFVHDGDVVRYANDRLAELVGADSPEAVVDRDPLSFVHPEERETAVNRIAAVLEEGEATDWHEYRIETVDGERRWIETRAVPVEYDGDAASQVVIRDVTDRHRREERLAHLHEATRTILTATDRESVASAAVSALSEVFADPIGVLWEYDRDADELVPLAATERAAERAGAPTDVGVPALGSETPEMEVFVDGEERVIQDYAARDDAVTDAIETTFLVPLDEHGLLGIASPEPYDFGATERELVGILARAATAAFGRLCADED